MITKRAIRRRQYKMPGPTKMLILPVSETSSTAQIVSRKSPVLKATRKSSVGNEYEPLPTLDLSSTTTPEQIKPQKVEPLLEENPNRHVIFPIEHGDIWMKYKQHMSVFWIPEEIDLSNCFFT